MATTNRKQEIDPEYNQLLSDIKEVLRTPGGRNVIWEILSICSLYSVGGGEILEGKRSVGVEILQIMEDADPTGYARLLLTKQKEKSNV